MGYTSTGDYHAFVPRRIKESKVKRTVRVAGRRRKMRSRMARREGGLTVLRRQRQWAQPQRLASIPPKDIAAYNFRACE